MARRVGGVISKAEVNGRGRSRRQEARREEFLLAASEVFFKDGFSGANVDDVIAKVGGSKRTLYSYFGNKEDLFSAVIRDISVRAMAGLVDESVCRATLHETLFEIGNRYLRVIMQPDTVHLYRTISAEGIRFPHLPQVFFENGPGRASRSLARTLEKNRDVWVLRDLDYERAAEHFFGMVRGDIHLKVVLGLRPPPEQDEIRSTVASIVDLFADGCRDDRHK